MQCVPFFRMFDWDCPGSFSILIYIYVVLILSGVKWGANTQLPVYVRMQTVDQQCVGTVRSLSVDVVIVCLPCNVV